MPAAGGEPRPLISITLNIEPRKRRLAWSSDSRWVLLGHRAPDVQKQRLYAVSVAIGNELQLTGFDPAASSSDGQPSLSRDRRSLFFARDAATAGQIWTVPLTSDFRPAGPEHRILIPGFDSRECSMPTPLSTREMLLLIPSRGGNALWRASLAGKQTPEELAELGSYLDAPELSSDGHSLVYVHEIFDTNLWRLDLDQPAGKEVRRERVVASTLRDQNASLSPDGAHLAFESNRSGGFEIFTANPDGSSTNQITFAGTLTSSPLWSPDGREIAFHANINGKQQVLVVAASGGPYL
jgi:Tol biopolymer transport system component